MIHLVARPGEAPVYVISSHHVWLPGSYESERAAKYAFRFSNTALETLQQRKNAEAGGVGGVVAFSDLQALRQEGKNQC